ncbi:MAG TPA: zinc ribbon domain-containing protein [Blastocatellia bacterium]
MSTNFCPGCGANADTTAKFCRRCGALLNVNEAAVAAPSEATTRELDRPAVQTSNPTTQPVNAGPTGTAYVNPEPGPSDPLNLSQYHNMMAAQQQPQRSDHKRLLILAAIFIVVLTGLAVLGSILAYRFGLEGKGAPKADAPEANGGVVNPPAPPGNGPVNVPLIKVPPIEIPPIKIPPINIPPEDQPKGGKLSGALEKLRYPGSEVTMSKVKGDTGVLVLSTPDPLSKVTEWYSQAIHPTKSVDVPMGSVLKAGRTKVMLTSVSGYTNIVVTNEDDD